MAQSRWPKSGGPGEYVFNDILSDLIQRGIQDKTENIVALTKPL
jgi:hypothetical protein